MKSFIHRTKIQVRNAAAVMAVVAFDMSTALAALPTVAPPSNNATGGDFKKLLQGYALDFAILAGLLLSTYALIRVCMNLVGVYGEVHEGKKKWGDMGTHAVAGVLLLVMCVYLLDQAAKVLA